MRLSLLPIDSRPCTYRFPLQLAALKGVKVTVPPLSTMDDYKTPSIYENISKWIEGQAAVCDEMVVSVEQLLYGGLIASRTMRVSQEESLRRLEQLKCIKQRYPALKIHAFTIIMRTSVSTLSAESQVWWQKVNAYSRSAYLYEITGEERYAQQVQQLRSEIPSMVLQQFLEARKRNHAVNMRCVEMAYEGIISSLLLLQEDSEPFGIHKKEQKALIERIATYGLEDRIHMHNGTDEAACEILARIICQKQKQRIKLAVQWLGEDKDSFTALYEDRPFIVNLQSHLRTTGLTLVDKENDADGVLFIFLPKGIQGDACIHPDQLCDGYSSSEVEAFAVRISGNVEAGIPVALLDLAFANGGDGKLLSALSKRFPVLRLCGYSAWNTASNSLGTLLSQIALSGFCNTLSNQCFTSERLLDDYIYQSRVRPAVEKLLRQKGEDSWNIEDRALAQTLINNQFKECRFILDSIFWGKIPEYTAQLKWNRIFEIEITVQCNFKTGGYHQ